MNEPILGSNYECSTAIAAECYDKIILDNVKSSRFLYCSL